MPKSSLGWVTLVAWQHLETAASHQTGRQASSFDHSLVLARAEPHSGHDLQLADDVVPRCAPAKQAAKAGVTYDQVCPGQATAS